MRNTAERYRDDLGTYDFPRLSHKELTALHTRAVRHQDKEAWHTLWMHGARLVLKICNTMRTIGQIHSVDAYNEAVSAGNLAIGEALLTWRPREGKFGTWVWLTVRWAVLSELNQEAAQGGKNYEPGLLVTNTGQTYDDFETFLAESNAEDHKGLWYLEIERLRDSIWMLPDREAKFVRLVYIEGTSQAQVAQDEDISPQMVNKILGRAINRLRENLE